VLASVVFLIRRLRESQAEIALEFSERVALPVESLRLAVD